MSWKDVIQYLASLPDDNNGVLCAREWAHKHFGGKYGVPMPKNVEFEDGMVFVGCDDRGWVFYPSGSYLCCRSLQ